MGDEQVSPVARCGKRGAPTALDELGFQLQEPELGRVASWTARGLTAYDAAYAALAEAEGLELITDDELITALAPHVAVELASLV